MMGRKQNDVFVLGDESLAAEPIGARDSGSAALEDVGGPTGELPGPGSSASGGAALAPASAPRRLAVLGLSAGAAAVTAGLVISAKPGSQDAPPQPQASSARQPLSAVVAGSVAAPVPARPRRPLDPRPRPKRPRHQPRPRPRGEPQRETTTDSAPDSSPVDVVAGAVDPPPAPASSSLSPERAVVAERRRRFGGEGGVRLRALAMAGRAAEPLGATAARVGRGWESVRRARFAALAPRYLATSALLVFFGLGVRAAFFAPKPSPPPPPRAAADAPSEDFALQFARAYLTYDAARPGRSRPRPGAVRSRGPRLRRRLLCRRRRPAGALGARSPPTSQRWSAGG